MSDSKSPFFSVTIWGAFFAILSTVLSMFHIQLADAGGFANDVVTLLGSAFAIYGRIRATHKIA